jgi:hypothetical protein
MMVLSARFIKAPQSLVHCDHCGWPVCAHIRLYGMAHREEKPYTLRFHPDCVTECIDISQEPKIESALKRTEG